VQCSDEAGDEFMAICSPFTEHKHQCYYSHIKSGSGKHQHGK
jgi:hypothetical protein